MQYPILESMLSDIAVVRTSLETLDMFAPDDPIRAEIIGIMTDARDTLLDKLRPLGTASPGRLVSEYDIELEAYSYWALVLAEHGYPRRKLDSMMKLDVFGAVADGEGRPDGKDQLFFWEFNQPVDLQAAKRLSAHEVYYLFARDLIQSAEEPANYAAKYLFDRHVSQKYIAFLFAHYAGTDPFFYGGGGPDSGFGSPVPRRPIPPQRSGGAAEPVPGLLDRDRHYE